LSTNSIHAGRDNSKDPHRPLITPIYQTATYEFDQVEDLWAYYQKRSPRLVEYARYGSPTQRAVEINLLTLEGAEECALTASGMNAIVSAICAFCNSGDHIIVVKEGYRGTFKMMTNHLTRMGIEIDYVDVSLEAIQKAHKANTKLVFWEIPTNPYMRLVDIEPLTQWAKAKNILTLADSTLASPYNFRPLEHGVDLVTHSVTKYLNGHNDLIAGAVLGKKSLIEKVAMVRGLFGSNPDPHLCYLISRGLKTFSVRMREHNASALKIAQYLESHPAIERVWYPLLDSHPDFALAKKIFRGGSGLVSFQVKGGLRESTLLVEALSIPALAASLGGVESLVHQPTVMSYYDMPPEQRVQEGIFDNLIRYSVGLEDVEDLIADLESALGKL